MVLRVGALDSGLMAKLRRGGERGGRARSGRGERERERGGRETHSPAVWASDMACEMRLGGWRCCGVGGDEMLFPRGERGQGGEWAQEGGRGEVA